MPFEIKRRVSDEIESEILRQMAKACAGVRRERFDTPGLLPAKRDRHLSAGLLAQKFQWKFQASAFRGFGFLDPVNSSAAENLALVADQPGNH
jgi:hypothetical protein